MEIKTSGRYVNEKGAIHQYYLVPAFDANSQHDWDALRTKSKAEPGAVGQVVIIHFLNLQQHYELSPTHELIGEPYHKAVIAQYTRDIYGRERFNADPMGLSIYEEPAPPTEGWHN